MPLDPRIPRRTNPTTTKKKSDSGYAYTPPGTAGKPTGMGQAPQGTAYQKFLNDNGITNSDMTFDQFRGYGQGARDFYKQNPIGTVVGTSSPGGSGGGGGGDGGAAAALEAAQNAIASLFQMWQTPDQTPAYNDVLTPALQASTDAARATGNAAMDNLRNTLNQATNPYQAQFSAPRVAANPLEKYMTESGADTSAVEALRSLLQSTADQTAQADQMVNDRQGQSYQNEQQSRQQDASTMQASFEQNLAANKSGMEASIAAKKQAYLDERNAANQARKDEMMMQILQLAITNGIDLNSLGVKFG